MRRIAFFEDAAAAQFAPLTLLRPVFELLCGHFCLRERLLQTPAEWGAFVRPWLAAAYREEHPEAHVNDTSWLRQGPTLLVNGRWLPDGLPLPELRDGEAGFAGFHAAYHALHARFQRVAGQASQISANT